MCWIVKRVGPAIKDVECVCGGEVSASLRVDLNNRSRCLGSKLVVTIVGPGISPRKGAGRAKVWGRAGGGL